jgi:cell division protein FtsW
MNLRRLVPFADSPVQEWAIEARLLHWLTFSWLLIGLVVLFSASYHIGMVESGDGLYYVKRQLFAILLGLVGFWLVVHLPLQRFIAIAPLGFFICLGLIFATHIPGLGTEVNGATRWISLGPVPLQPSEVMKPFLVLQSAQVFSRWARLPMSERLKWLSLFAVTLLAILTQPNLSTTALCGMMLWLMALAAGVSFSSLGMTAIAGVGTAVLSISVNDYQRRRLLSFMDPWTDSLGDGFQLSQSLLSVGSGGLTGTGFGLSQQKLSYLPIQHTDFIFSIYAEEFGLMGSAFLLLLLLGYSMLALKVALKSTDLGPRLVATGSMVFLVGQSLINIGVAIGVLPTTGLPLPLFSYGGSSMIASLFLAGLVIRVARESHEADVMPFNPAPDLRSVPSSPPKQPRQPSMLKLAPKQPRQRRRPLIEQQKPTSPPNSMQLRRDRRKRPKNR